MTKAYSKISGYDRPHVYVFVSDKQNFHSGERFQKFPDTARKYAGYGGSKSGMFQVLLQYFEDRYASFYVQNPITDFTELLERVRKAVPVLKGIPDDQIRISYKDVQLATFVNIDSHEQLHLQETFRNAFPCGSDSYRRVHLKVRESDSPFLLKSSRS